MQSISPKASRFAPELDAPAPKRAMAGSAVARPLLNDERELEAIRRQFPGVINAPEIEHHRWVMPWRFNVVHDVEMDDHAVFFLRPGEAAKTSGLATCYGIAATAKLPDGRILVGLSHATMARPMEDAELARYEVELLVDAMQKAAPGCDVRMFIAGGLVSRLERNGPDGEPTSVDSTVEIGKLLVEAAFPWLVSARLGLSESNIDEFPDEILREYENDGYEIRPTTARPPCVSMFVTWQGEVIVVDGDGDDCHEERARAANAGVRQFTRAGTARMSEPPMSDAEVIAMIRHGGLRDPYDQWLHDNFRIEPLKIWPKAPDAT